jgi:TolB-like protein/Tfp pilus assembly protein PilF
MKRCPECGRDYNDDSMSFCLDDGAELLFGPATPEAGTVNTLRDEPHTAILHETAPPADAVTQAYIHTSEQNGGLVPVTNEFPKRGFDKRLLALPFLLAVVGIAGFYSYRYLTPGNQINSIAVMPFVNASGNQDLEYLSDGVTESLINNLSQLSKLSVKNRSSVFRYKGKDVEPQLVAADLKVQAVLNGRVTQRGDNLTISLDLVDGATGNQIWGYQYARKTGDLAVLQSEIARDVSQKLRARLTGEEETRVVKNQTQNTEAYQLYLQGRFNWNKRTDQTTTKAIELFQQAIEKDPNYAMAYVGLAESYVLDDTRTDEDAYPKIKAAAEKALAIDPTLGEPHAVLGVYFDTYEGDHEAGEREFKKAMELSPNYSTSYHWWAETLVSWGRFDEGLAVYKKALEIDPFSLAIGTDYGIALFYARRYDESINELKKLTEIDPTYIRTYTYIARVYEAAGRFEDALNAHEKRMMLQGEDPKELAEGKQAILTAFRSSGAKGYWERILAFQLEDLKKGKDVQPIVLARTYTQLGERDEAFKWIDKAMEGRVNDSIFMLNVSPEWDGIRSDPRFTKIIEKLRLP